MADEEDRISSLPDGLLVEIISRIKTEEPYYERTLTTKEVIRTTSTLSKRWQHLWTQCPNLSFLIHYDINYEDVYDDPDHTDYFSFIDKTLFQCPIHVKLNKFKVNINYNSWVDSKTRGFPHINSWIRYAITRNVQEVELLLSDSNVHDYGEPVWYDDELFFNNSCITSIRIWSCKFYPPNGAIRWDKLKSLSINGGVLNEDMIEKILSGSPVLETIDFRNCYGFKQIDISSTSVKNFVFSTSNSWAVIIKINAPYILSLTINNNLHLEKLLLLNVSSLVKAELDYSSKKTFYGTREDIEDEELLKGLLQSLGHVKHIKLGNSRLEVLSRIMAKGFQFYGDVDRLPELFASAAVDTKTQEKIEETGESDDDMGLMSLFD